MVGFKGSLVVFSEGVGNPLFQYVGFHTRIGENVC